MVERLFIAVPRGCLQFVIVVFLIKLTYYFGGKHPSNLAIQNGKIIPFIDVAPITQLRTCVIKIVTFKGGHLMW